MKWWGRFSLSGDSWARWQIGPLVVFARPAPGEWTTAYTRIPDAAADTCSVELDAQPPAGMDFTYARHAVNRQRTDIDLSARLADRPFVVSPEEPLFLLAGQSTVLYVGTSVWVQFHLGSSAGDVLLEMPAYRRSDTWFGADTLVGELCYASRSAARTDLTKVRVAPNRVTTPIEIRNEGSTVLPIERLLVPVPALSLYADVEHRLWTDAVRFVRNEGESQASQSIVKGGAHLPDQRTVLDQPRLPAQSGMMVRAFSRLWS